MMLLRAGRESCASVYFGFFLRDLLEGPLVVGDLEVEEEGFARCTPGRVFCWVAGLRTLEAVELDLPTLEDEDVDLDLLLLLLLEEGLPRD